MIDDENKPIVDNLRDSARTILSLVENSTNIDDILHEDLRCINHVIEYYGGEHVTSTALDPTEYELGYTNGFQAGFERGAYETMTSEDVAPDTCKCVAPECIVK